MNIKEVEKLIINEFKKIMIQIIQDHPKLNISAKSRVGAELSDFLEEKFVKYSNTSDVFKNSKKSPKGATKNPWDVKTTFSFKNLNEIIWIDFKALKISSKDSNPDIGTPNKIIKFIKEGHFYLLYIYVFYNETKNGLKFMKVNGDFIKLYFLKDIHHSFRRNPKNQLQVNISEKPEYRSRTSFIKLLMNKISESHNRQIKISQKALKTLAKEEKILLQKNRESEIKILNNLK